MRRRRTWASVFFIWNMAMVGALWLLYAFTVGSPCDEPPFDEPPVLVVRIHQAAE